MIHGKVWGGIKRVGDVITPGFDIPGESERRARRQIGKNVGDIDFTRGLGSGSPQSGLPSQGVPSGIPNQQGFGERGLADFGGGSGGGGWWSDAWDWLKDNPEVALLVAKLISDARRNSKSDALNDEALGFAREDRERLIKDQAELKAGIMGIEAARPDLSDTFADPSNPFYRAPAQVSAVPTTPGGPPTPGVTPVTPVPKGGGRGGGSEGSGEIDVTGSDVSPLELRFRRRIRGVGR